MHTVTKDLKMTDQKTQTKKKIWETLTQEIDLPEGVSVKYENYELTITGPKGEISKKLRYPRVHIKIENSKIILETKRLTKREKRIIFTYRAHINNLIKGVTEGFEYRLSVVYAKFPMSVEVKDNEFIVKNLLGEKVPRTVKLPSDVKVEVKSKDITVSGIDKERVGQVAASLEQSTRITHFDRRVIQDGIFIVEKPHRRYV